MSHLSPEWDGQLLLEDRPPYDERELASFLRLRVWKDFCEVVKERQDEARSYLEKGVLPAELQELVTKHNWTPREVDCFLRGRLMEDAFFQAWPDLTMQAIKQEETNDAG